MLTNPNLLQQSPDALPGMATPSFADPARPAGLTPDPNGLQHPLRPICTGWLTIIQKALEIKKAQFMDDANECMKFFHGPYDFLYRRDYATSSPGFKMNAAEAGENDFPAPTFQMTCNKVAEMVQIFGPVLYHKNPERQVNARKLPDIQPGMIADPNDPLGQLLELAMAQSSAQRQQQDAARAKVIEAYLNWTPNELNLKDHSRAAIDETLIKGMGVLWTELHQPPGSKRRLVGSFYDSVDNLVIDPDAESLEDARWIARRCIHPIWEVERKYGFKPGTLTGNVESYTNQAQFFGDPDADWLRKTGRTADLLVYWKVYSKMGLGARLQGMPPYLRTTLDGMGDYCYLVVADNYPYPLNVPPELLGQPGATEEIQRRIDWPTPFWLDNKWPMTAIRFHPIPRRVWPMSHLKPALGELKFLNWAYSFIASKIRVSGRDFLAMKKSVGEEMKDAILHGRDYTLIELSATHPGAINDIVQFLQHPQMNGDVWKVLEIINHNFELRTGLTELAYGESARQMRSAEEAGLKREQLSVRPEDMATRVEEAMTELARKEALAARWHLTYDDVRPVLGDLGAYYWIKLVVTTDLEALCHELEYWLEAGSTRKPNRERDADNANQAVQTWLPFFQSLFGIGQVGPMNALIDHWCRTRGLDPADFAVEPPPPPPPPVPPGGPAGPPPPEPGPPAQGRPGPPATSAPAPPGPFPPPFPGMAGPPGLALPPLPPGGLPIPSQPAPGSYPENTPSDLPQGPPTPPAVISLLGGAPPAIGAAPPAAPGLPAAPPLPPFGGPAPALGAGPFPPPPPEPLPAAA